MVASGLRVLASLCVACLSLLQHLAEAQTINTCNSNVRPARYPRCHCYAICIY